MKAATWKGCTAASSSMLLLAHQPAKRRWRLYRPKPGHFDRLVRRSQTPDAGAGHLGGKLEPLRDVPEGRLLFFALGDVLDNNDYIDHRSFFVTYRNLIGLARLGGFV
jgi:hypothetical protein